MAKSKARNTVVVEVDEAESSLLEATPWRQLVEEERPNRPKADLGGFWEACFGIGAIVGLVSAALSSHLRVEGLDCFCALLMLVGFMIPVGISGFLSGSETPFRKRFGNIALMLGVAMLSASLVIRVEPLLFWLLAVGFCLLPIGWSLRRFRGESIPRCVSLGVVMLLPFVFLRGGLLPDVWLDAIQGWVQGMTYFTVGVVADLNQVPFSPSDSGLDFSMGSFTTSGAFGGFSGILVAIAFSLGISLAFRHSTIVALLCVSLAMIWWMIFRGSTCVYVASQNQFDGPLTEQGLSVLGLLSTLVVIAGTNIGVGALLGQIPIPFSQYDLSPMTVVYNSMVNWPQLGPTSLAMLPDDAQIAALEVAREESLRSST